MKKQLLFFFALLLIITACSKTSRYQNEQKWFLENGKIKVLTTTSMIQDLVKEIGKDHVDVISLVNGELDPHSYQLVKGDGEKLLFANIIFYNGLGLEHGASTREYLENAKKAVPLGELLLKKEPSSFIYVDGTIDPHIWMDISLWSKLVPFIVETLSAYDPKHAEEYQKQGILLKKMMEEKHEEIRQKLNSIPKSKRYLVTSHDAFHYFGKAYLKEDDESDWKKRVAAPEGLAPESQISVYDIRLIVNHLKDYQIHVLFPESNVSQDSIKKIQDAGLELGMKIEIARDPLYGDSMGPLGSSGDGYFNMIEHNANVIHQYLSK